MPAEPPTSATPPEYACSECDATVTPAEMGAHHADHDVASVTFTLIPTTGGVA